MKKLTRIYPDGENDYEVKYYVREISGPMTPKRWRMIERYAQAHSWRESCGCPGDCCGCHFERTVKVTYEYNQLVVRVTDHFNY